MKKEIFLKNYDVFRSFLVEKADYEGFYELPVIKTSDKIPEKLIPFSKAMSKNHKDFDCWVVFYEYDVKFERLWNNPRRYLNKLQKFKGVISPDFSIYRDMPLVMQIWNTYKGRAIAVWLQNNGIEVIPNVRFGDERSYSFVFDGIESGKTVSVSTYGAIKKKEDRLYFKVGLAKLVNALAPETIIVYGSAPDEIFEKYRDKGIKIIPFESELSSLGKRVKA